MKVRIKKLSPDAVVPRYATPGSVGFDLVATEDVSLLPGETKLVSTGLSFEIPEGYELQVRPRSGVSLKTKLRVANAPGTVDSDFRGAVSVIMTNTSTARSQGFAGTIGEATAVVTEAIQIKKGERIAQGVIAPVIQAEFEVAEDLSETERGAGGFGSTGK
jgi:dUTP pyrophosphatase